MLRAPPPEARSLGKLGAVRGAAGASPAPLAEVAAREGRAPAAWDSALRGSGTVSAGAVGLRAARSLVGWETAGAVAAAGPPALGRLAAEGRVAWAALLS